MNDLAGILGQCWLCDQSGKLVCGCCNTCFADLPRLPPHNLRPVECEDYCSIWLAAFSYQKPVQGWLQAFKFSAQPALARDFATLISAQVLIFHKQQCMALPTQICTIPMSWRRWRGRGYNQAELLAKAVAKILGVPYQPLLVRQVVRQTAQQAGEQAQHALSRSQRFTNMQGAFRATQEIKGGHIAVVDDVITTGATLNSAALTLLQAGAEQVSGWSLAYTPAAPG